MAKKTDADRGATARLGAMLVGLRRRSRLTQAEVARRMGTTQTAIARLEAGRQSPSMRTLQDYARANGFCLEIGFVRTAGPGERSDTVMAVHDLPS